MQHQLRSARSAGSTARPAERWNRLGRWAIARSSRSAVEATAERAVALEEASPTPANLIAPCLSTPKGIQAQTR